MFKDLVYFCKTFTKTPKLNRKMTQLRDRGTVFERKEA